jgi:hypothetical protein
VEDREEVDRGGFLLTEDLDFLENLDYDDDFGFSTVEETEVLSDNERVEKLKSMFLPLLSNLLKNPEADYIYWPNRSEKIEAIIKQVQEI